MTSNLCLKLAFSFWVVGFAIVFCQMLFIQLPFSGNYVISYVYCEVGSILKTTCADILEFLGLLATILVIPGSLLFLSLIHI